MRKPLEAISLVVLVWMVWITWSALAGPNRLPGRIPTHFNVSGEPDSWGTPSMLLLLPIVSLGLYTLITVVSRFPAAFNYPVRILPQVRQQAESITLDMIAWVKAELLLLMAFLQNTIVRAAHGGDPRLHPLAVPAFIVLIFVTIGGHMVAVIRAARATGTR